MTERNRLICALKGATYGLLIGGAGWWLYGLAHSLNYTSPEIDPVLVHWLAPCITVFAGLGFVFRSDISEIVCDTFSAILSFELNEVPDGWAGIWVWLAFTALLVIVLWHAGPAA